MLIVRFVAAADVPLLHATVPANVQDRGRWLGNVLRQVQVAGNVESGTRLKMQSFDSELVVIRHALKGAMLPVVSYLGPAAAAVITGSVVIESIFDIPGLGRYFVQGALNRDYTLVMGTVVMTVGRSEQADGHREDGQEYTANAQQRSRPRSRLVSPSVSRRSP